MRAERGRTILWGLLVAALVVRLVWGFLQPGEIDAKRLPDQAEYLELGDNLLRQRALHFYDERFRQDLWAYRTPGYPIFVAAMGAVVRVVRAAQAFVDASTVLAAFLLARRWLRLELAVVAAALVAFNPFLVYFTGLILSETLYTAMLAWGAVLLVYRPGYLWGGIILALSVLVRPAAVGLTIVLGIAAAFAQRVRGDLSPPRWFKPPVGTGMLLLTLLALSPWAIRNKVRLGEWVWLTTNGGITRYDGFNPSATGASDQSFLRLASMQMFVQAGEVERDRAFADFAGDYARETWEKDKARLMKLTLSKIARTWSPVPLSDDFGRPLYRVAAATYAIPLYLLAVVGLFSRAIPRSGKAFLLTPAIYFTMVHALTVGSLRYRVPVEPLLAVPAAAGLGAVMTSLRRSPYQRSGATDV